jgi:hypothetical protein
VKHFGLLLAAVALAFGTAAWLGTPHASAAEDPVSGWLDPSCGGNPSDDPFEGEQDCKRDTSSTRICVDSQHYKTC